MKNRLAAAALPVLSHLRAPHVSASVGLIERSASNKEVSTVRVLTEIKRDSSADLYSITTIIQYQAGAGWSVYARECCFALPDAVKVAYSLSRKAFKAAVSREFAVSLHADVYVPDTEDIKC